VSGADRTMEQLIGIRRIRRQWHRGHLPDTESRVRIRLKPSLLEAPVRAGPSFEVGGESGDVSGVCFGPGGAEGKSGVERREEDAG